MRALLLLAGLVACSPKSGGGSADAADDGSGVGADSGLAAAEGTCDASGGRLHWVVDELWFARIEDGVSDGFDLDGDASTVGGDGGCGVADEVGLDGQAGIDNAFGKLIPALELTEFVAAEDLINSTIRSGELLLLGELSGVEDLQNDDCVGMAMRRATGEPLLGTDGAFLAGQTLDLDPEFSDVELSEQQLVNGVASGRPFQLDLPVQVLNASLEFRLRDGAMRLDLTEDGDASGIFAGGLNTADLIAVAGEEGIDESVVNVLSGLLDNVADLDPDEAGQCQAISVTLGFHATPVYIYEDAW